MRRIAVGIGVAAVAALFVSQFVLPPVLERGAEDRLTESGGSADVSLDAVPALRLLASRGDRLEVDAQGIRLELGAETSGALSELDGFDHVMLRLRNVRIGPFVGDELTMARPEGAASYRLEVRGAVGARELATYAASRYAGPLGALAAGIGSRAVPADAPPIPVQLSVDLASDDGRPRVLSGAGTIAGIPAGPLGELMAAAVAAEL